MEFGNQIAISAELDCAIIKSTFRDACFRQLENLRQESLIIGLDAPKQYNVKIGEYVFDFIQKDDDRVLFVKIWDEIGTHVDKAEFIRLENAASKLVPLYNGIFILFSIHRFSDYCWKCAGKYENVKLVQVDAYAVQLEQPNRLKRAWKPRESSTEIAVIEQKDRAL